MATIAIVSGSGFPAHRLGDGRAVSVAGRWGQLDLTEGTIGAHRVLAVSRHGAGHHRLSHQLDHRALIGGLAELGAEAILATTAVGVLDPDVPLGTPIVFTDLLFPSNRLPDGSLATFFTATGDPRRGHWIPREPFSPRLRALVLAACTAAGHPGIDGGIYAHADGPRFNTVAELRVMMSAGAVAVSQTCGPEAVLAGEAGLPYALVGFGVNYGSGVASRETTDEELAALLDRHGRELPGILAAAITGLPDDVTFACDTGSVFRIEGGAQPRP